MTSKLLLLLGIPLVFIAAIAAYETGQLLWLGLVVPLAIARYAMHRAIASKDDLYVPKRDRPEQFDATYVATATPPTTNAPLLYELVATCRFDPDATSAYDLLAGGLVWTDETPPSADRGNANFMLRRVIAYRASLSLGEPRTEFEEHWNDLKRHVPDWPGFRDDRIHGRAQRLLKVHMHKEAKLLREDGFDL